MTWMNTLQIALLLLWFALLANLVANNVVKNFWTTSSKYYDDNEDTVDRELQKAGVSVTRTGNATAARGGVANTGLYGDEPKPHTTWNAV